MAENGVVTAVTEDSLLIISMQRNDACAKCGACVSFKDDTTMRLTAKNCCKASIGDTVEITLESNRFLLAVLLLYGVPLAAFLAAILICSLCRLFEPLSLLISLAAALLGWLAVHRYAGKIRQEKYLPKAVRIVTPE